MKPHQNVTKSHRFLSISESDSPLLLAVSCQATMPIIKSDAKPWGQSQAPLGSLVLGLWSPKKGGKTNENDTHFVSHMTQIWVTWKKIDTISYCCCIDHFSSDFKCLDSCKNWKGLKFTISTQVLQGIWNQGTGQETSHPSSTGAFPKNGWWKWLIRKTNKKGQHLNPSLEIGGTKLTSSEHDNYYKYKKHLATPAWLGTNRIPQIQNQS